MLCVHLGVFLDSNLGNMKDLELCKVHVLYLNTPKVVDRRDNRDRQNEREEKVEGVKKEREIERAENSTKENTKQ